MTERYEIGVKIEGECVRLDIRLIGSIEILV